jgi:RNA polymerase sigma factor (sigma-70 family)
MQIAINVCMTHLRAKQARRSWHETIETPQLGHREIWEPAGVERPDDALNRKECHEILEDSISKLPQQYHSVVRMRYVQDRSYIEISRELGVPMGTLKTWLYRARRQLQEILNETELRAM